MLRNFCPPKTTKSKGEQPYLWPISSIGDKRFFKHSQTPFRERTNEWDEFHEKSKVEIQPGSLYSIALRWLIDYTFVLFYWNSIKVFDIYPIYEKNSRIFLIKIIPKIDENSLIIFIFWQNWFSEAISVCSTINSGKNVNGGSMGRRKERDRRTFFISGWVVLRQCYDVIPPFPILDVPRFSHIFIRNSDFSLIE